MIYIYIAYSSIFADSDTATESIFKLNRNYVEHETRAVQGHLLAHSLQTWISELLYNGICFCIIKIT